MARVLVTGAGGFVGKHLARHLRSLGDTVWGTTLTGDPNPEYTAVALDVTDAERTLEVVREVVPDEVYHLAALSRPGLGDGAGYLDVNLGGTLHVLAAAATVHARVLLVSSAYVYGRHDDVITESSAIVPIDPYGASKAAAEMAGVTFALTGQHVVRVRPFNHVGPGQSSAFFVPTVIEQVRAIATGRAEPRLALGNLDAVRDVSDVRDVVRAYPAALRAAAAGAVYNVSSGVGVSMRGIVDRAIALAGIDVEIVTDPERLRPNDLPYLVGSAAALEAATGWRPERDLDATIAEMLAGVGA